MFVQDALSAMPSIHSINAYRVNQGAAAQATALQPGRIGLRPLQDMVSISPYGKTTSALSGLEKLRQQIEDRRSEFLTKATEEGQSTDVIQAHLDSFDQQLKDIDKQIAQLTTQQMNQEMEKSKNTAGIQHPKTRQEVENERLADITKMSAGLEKVNAIHSVKRQVDGDIGVKESEIELEKSRGGDTTQMEVELSELQRHSNQLIAGIQEHLNETLEEIKESSDKVINADIVDAEETINKDTGTNDNVEGVDSTIKTRTQELLYKSIKVDVPGIESDVSLQSSLMHTSNKRILRST